MRSAPGSRLPASTPNPSRTQHQGTRTTPLTRAGSAFWSTSAVTCGCTGDNRPLAPNPNNTAGRGVARRKKKPRHGHFVHDHISDVPERQMRRERRSRAEARPSSSGQRGAVHLLVRCRCVNIKWNCWRPGKLIKLELFWGPPFGWNQALRNFKPVAS